MKLVPARRWFRPSRVGAALLVAASVGIPTRAAAQEKQQGLLFAMDVPQGAYRLGAGRNGYGAATHFAMRIGTSLLLWGGETGFRFMGQEKRTERSSTNPDVTAQVRTDSAVIPVHFVLRTQRRTGAMRPYADGVIGFKYLTTKTSISTSEGGSTRRFGDTTLSYGFGGGIQGGLTQNTWLDVKVRYLRGGLASYVKKVSIQQIEPRVLFDVVSSRTDVIAVQVGISRSF